MRLVRGGVWSMLALYVAVSVSTFAMHVPIRASWLFVMPLLSLVALVGLWRTARKGREVGAFVMSCCFIVTLLVTAAGTLFPYLLPAFPGREGGGMSIFEAAPSATVAELCPHGRRCSASSGGDVQLPTVWQAHGRQDSRRMTRAVSIGIRRSRARAIRSLAPDALLDRKPFGTRSGLRRARAGAAQPRRDGERSRAHVQPSTLRPKSARSARLRRRGCRTRVVCGDSARRTCSSGCSRRTCSSLRTARSKSTCNSSIATTRSKRGSCRLF